MRKLVLILAMVGLVASPVLAELAPSSFNPSQRNLGAMSGHTVGIPGVTPYGGPGPIIPYDQLVYAAPSDTLIVNFAFHWPYSGSSVSVVQFQSQLVYDNSEVAVVSTTPLGIFATGGNNNFPGPTTWATLFNPSSGTLAIGDVLGTGTPLWQNPAAFGTVVLASSGVYPFMQVELHVKNGLNSDGLLDVVIGQAAMLFYLTYTPGTYWTAGNIGVTSYGMSVSPEPASLTLLAGGVLALGGGFWRRRRR